MNFANVNSPIPVFSTKIVPDLHGFTYLTRYFQFPKICVIRGPPVLTYLLVFSGATALLHKYVDSSFSVETMEYVPTIQDTYYTTIAIQGRPINLGLYDTAGQEDYARFRPNYYPGAVSLYFIQSISMLSTFLRIEMMIFYK